MKRIVVGITGASGAIYGVKTLEILRHLCIDKCEYEVHLVLSDAAKLTLKQEMNLTKSDLQPLCHFYHPIRDIGASIASGSFKVEGMIIAPCSIKTMSEVAHSISSNLLTRAADVVLKEQRRLVLLVRETPLHLGHLENMTRLARMNAIIMPPVPAFYDKPANIQELVLQTVYKAIQVVLPEVNLLQEWSGCRPK